MVQEGMRDAAQHQARHPVASTGAHEDQIRLQGPAFCRIPSTGVPSVAVTWVR